ncbi:hypothetical protein [Mesorhizobium sp. 1B3]|uniref:hypothetical protein n=1 Tax=Mesorhizobium sp. 1B3 TaxID=3243599 RepID=UPI003D9A070A
MTIFRKNRTYICYFEVSEEIKFVALNRPQTDRALLRRLLKAHHGATPSLEMVAERGMVRPAKNKEEHMPLTGITDPGQLALLTAVLEDYCRKQGIKPETAEWYAAGRRLITIHSQGAASPGEMLAKLERQQHSEP